MKIKDKILNRNGSPVTKDQIFGSQGWYVDPLDKSLVLCRHEEKESIIADSIKSPANAQLIAAAPELLEACKIALEGLKRISPNEWTIFYVSEPDRIELLEKVVGKAEGKSS